MNKLYTKHRCDFTPAYVTVCHYNAQNYSENCKTKHVWRPGHNHAVYHNGHCNIQPWVLAAQTYCS